jgi:hypothetical protein
MSAIPTNGAIDLDELTRAITDAVKRVATNPQSAPPTNVIANSADVRGAGQLARAYLARRRARERILPPEVFAEPAWDILLDLFVARSEHRFVSVSGACIASAVPPTTALRWITKLEELGLVQRIADDLDRRRIWLKLDDTAASKIADWLSETFT